MTAYSLRRLVRQSGTCLGMLAVPWLGGHATRTLASRATSPSHTPPAPTISFSPASGTHFTSAGQTITITGCSSTAAVTDAILSLNGNGLSYSELGSGSCGTAYSNAFSTNVTLSAGANTLSATVCDVNGSCSSSDATYFYDAPGISVVPDNGSGGTVYTGANGTFEFTATNTGSVQGQVNVTWSCSGAILSNCSLGSATSFPLLPGHSGNITVNYQAGSTPGTGSIAVTATYSGFSGVSDGGSATVQVVNRPADHVTVSPSSASLQPGQTAQFSATVYDGLNNVLSGAPVSWSSNATGVATVAPSSGSTTTATAQGTGTATITATSGPASGTAQVTVGPAPPASVTVTLGASTIDVGQTTTAQATVRDASGNVLSGQTVSWGSTASGIASASSTGALTAQVSGVSAGQANITATTTNNITGSAPITVQNPPPPPPPPSNFSVSTNGINPGLTIARAQCLTVSLGSGAASECGDLRLAHALPTTRTLTVARTPMLLYSSAHAHPFPVLAVNVTLAGGVTRPDSVEAILRVNGVEKKRAKWVGTDLTPGGTSRIALGYDALSDATGIYSYTVEAVPYYGGSAASSATASGQLVIVNRSQSAFGAGWWLAGLEQFFAQGDGSKLWVGGDGSTRRYAPLGGNKYVAESVDFPDTLVFDGASTYTRLAPNGLKVQFNSSGNHTATVNRLGHTTSFTYVLGGTSPRLGTIILPPSGSGLSYTFAYDATNHLATVTAPPTGATTRVTTITIASNGQLESIADPDTKVVSFGYDATFFRRATSRTDRRLNTTSFTYDGGWKARQSTLPMGGSQPSIVMTVRTLETVGIHPATGQGRMIDTASAYALIDGPRTDVADTTMLWLDRWDAPRKIRDASGNVTLIERTNATLPALVTRVKRPNNHVMRAVHDARGHVTLATDSGGVVAGRPDSTRYVWNNTWDVVERIVPQEKDSTVVGIDAANGNRLWQQDARGTSSRVNFTYHAATGLLATVQQPAASGVDSLVYDARGNLARARTPLGFVSQMFADAVGRDTLTVSPIDATHTLRHRAVFDVVDQLTREETVGSAALTYALSASGLTPDTAAVRNDTLVKTHTYDDEGNRTGVSSYSTGGKTDVGTSESNTYDNANRVLTTDVGSGPRGFTYDPAGNAVALLYPTGKTVTQEFDALNRVAKRIVPERTFPKTRCQGFPTGPISATGDVPDCTLVFPYYPNDGTGLTLAADTSTFTYDAVGNTLAANNLYARVKRTYTLRGLLATDSLIFGSYATPSIDAERKGQAYTYDRDARRATMAWALGTTSYDYHPFGAPRQVTDPSGNTYHFVYDLQGRVDSLVVAASGGVVGVREKRTYDDDGRLTRRERVSATLGPLLLDSLFYDQRDKVARARSYSRAQATEGVALAYDPRGAVAAQERTRDVGGYQVEEYRTDAYGNAFYARTRSTAAGNDVPFVSSYAPDGAMLERHAVLPAVPSQNQREESVAQTAVGSDVEQTGRLVTIPSINGGGFAEQMAGRQYYSADDRLAVVQRYDYLVGSDDDVGTWEEFRYDALGRRILTRARRDLNGAPTGSRFLCRDLTNNTCGSYVERALWDGNRLLYEWRSAEATPTGMTDGSAGYVHAEGLDQPVAVLRPDGARVISYTWRGLGESSVFVSGAAGDCSLVVGSCALAAVDWPGKTQGGVYFTPNALATGPSGPRTWFGGLAANGGGSGGLLFRRNRFFDPTTGQFTQEDPIGLAGGMNLYGFAGGDPVNFSDPFGLCTPWPDCLLQSAANWGAQRGGALGGAVLNAAAGANAAAEALGVNDLGRAVADRDALGGTVALASMLPIGRAGFGLAKGIAKTIDRAQGAKVAFDRLGKFTRAVWEVAGDKGAGYVRWNRVLNEEGSTIRLFKDVYDQGGNYLRRDWYVGGPPK